MKCFKAYDIRGDTATEITPLFAYKLGQEIAKIFNAKKIVLGRDARISGNDLAVALASGFAGKNGKTFFLDLCCTEEIYRASALYDVDLGIMITASHNPVNENGFKIVKKGAIPVSGHTGLDDLKNAILSNRSDYANNFACMENTGDFRSEYANWLINYIKPVQNSTRLKILADAGNGCAGLIIKELAAKLPYDIILINSEADGSFPNGAPNPLLPEKRKTTAEAVIKAGADFGVAFDGDADRCFFYDHNGNFIEGYYLVGLLAMEILNRHPGEKILHDPRLYWNTRELAIKSGGIPVMSKTGHAFMKEKMRSEKAIYGGEMSAHHYFRDFYFCDSGMLPFLMIASLLSHEKRKLSDLVAQSQRKYPCSGEINRKVSNPDFIIEMIENEYSRSAINADNMDGVNMEFADWRFSLRKSNTEPLLRLNVETRANSERLQEKTEELLKKIKLLDN